MFLPIFGQLSVNFGVNSWEIGREIGGQKIEEKNKK